VLNRKVMEPIIGLGTQCNRDVG